MISENELTPDQKYKMEQVLFGMKKNKRNFVKKYGMKAEALMKKRALKIAKQYTPEPTNEEMEDNRLKKLVQDVLSKPLDEKKGKDLTGPGGEPDGKIDSRDYLAARDIAIKKAQSKLKESEDKINRYMFFSNLEQMRRQCDMLLDLDRSMIERILDDGHDWAQDHIAEAKSFLDQTFDFFMNETKKSGMQLSINMDDKDMMDEGKLTKPEERIVKALKKSGKFKKGDPEMYALAKKLAENIIQHLKNKK